MCLEKMYWLYFGSKNFQNHKQQSEKFRKNIGKAHKSVPKTTKKIPSGLEADKQIVTDLGSHWGQALENSMPLSQMFDKMFD